MGCLKLTYGETYTALKVVQGGLYGVEKGCADGYRYGFNGKENDTETSTQDYGFRIYNPGLGRWLSVDPLQKMYPGLSPYNAFENNPLFFKDPDGKDAVASIQGNTITFSATIYIIGHNATAQKAESIQDGIMNTWGKDFTYTDKNGKVYNVKFDIQVKVATNNKNEVKELSKGENLITLVDESKSEHRSYVKGGSNSEGWRTGKWGEDEDDNTYAHETGHLLGVDDLYYDTWYGSEIYKGVEENDLMAGGDDVTQKTINEMASYALSKITPSKVEMISNSWNLDRPNPIQPKIILPKQQVEVDASETRFRDSSKLSK